MEQHEDLFLNQLRELRDQLDVIDHKILALLKERFSITDAVAELKSINNRPILDRARESEILEKIKSLINGENQDVEKNEFDNLEPYIVEIYRIIMEQSKLKQEKMINGCYKL